MNAVVARWQSYIDELKQNYNPTASATRVCQPTQSLPLTAGDTIVKQQGVELVALVGGHVWLLTGARISGSFQLAWTLSLHSFLAQKTWTEKFKRPKVWFRADKLRCQSAQWPISLLHFKSSLSFKDDGFHLYHNFRSTMWLWKL